MEPLSYRHWIFDKQRTTTLVGCESLSSMPSGSRTSLSESLLLSQNYTEVLEMKPNILVLWLCGQHQPIIFVLRTRFLGCFRIRPVTQSLTLLDRSVKISPRHISTGPLHSLRNFHSQPINLIIFEVPYQTTL